MCEQNLVSKISKIRFKRLMSPAEQRDLVGVNGTFQVYCICAKRLVFYSMAQYGL